MENILINPEYRQNNLLSDIESKPLTDLEKLLAGQALPDELKDICRTLLQEDLHSIRAIGTRLQASLSEDEIKNLEDVLWKDLWKEYSYLGLSVDDPHPPRKWFVLHQYLLPPEQYRAFLEKCLIPINRRQDITALHILLSYMDAPESEALWNDDVVPLIKKVPAAIELLCRIPRDSEGVLVMKKILTLLIQEHFSTIADVPAPRVPGTPYCLVALARLTKVLSNDPTLNEVHPWIKDIWRQACINTVANHGPEELFALRTYDPEIEPLRWQIETFADCLSDDQFHQALQNLDWYKQAWLLRNELFACAIQRGLPVDKLLDSAYPVEKSGFIEKVNHLLSLMHMLRVCVEKGLTNHQNLFEMCAKRMSVEVFAKSVMMNHHTDKKDGLENWNRHLANNCLLQAGSKEQQEAAGVKKQNFLQENWRVKESLLYIADNSDPRITPQRINSFFETTRAAEWMEIIVPVLLKNPDLIKHFKLMELNPANRKKIEYLIEQVGQQLFLAPTKPNPIRALQAVLNLVQLTAASYYLPATDRDGREWIKRMWGNICETIDKKTISLAFVHLEFISDIKPTHWQKAYFGGWQALLDRLVVVSPTPQESAIALKNLKESMTYTAERYKAPAPGESFWTRQNSGQAAGENEWKDRSYKAIQQLGETALYKLQHSYPKKSPKRWQIEMFVINALYTDQVKAMVSHREFLGRWEDLSAESFVAAYQHWGFKKDAKKEALFNLAFPANGHLVQKSISILQKVQEICVEKGIDHLAKLCAERLSELGNN